MSRIIIGLDEVGRGPIAGPVTVGAVAIDLDTFDVPVNDSKQLTPARRRKLYPDICKQALAVAEAWVSPSDLDRYGMAVALERCFVQAYNNIPKDIRARAEQVLVDGDINQLIAHLDARPVSIIDNHTIRRTYGDAEMCRIGNSIVMAIVKGDGRFSAISAASIIAKVDRDNYMATAVNDLFPLYGFSGHKGYFAKSHYDAIKTHGPVVGLHRLSFKKLKEYYNQDGTLTDLGKKKRWPLAITTPCPPASFDRSTFTYCQFSDLDLAPLLDPVKHSPKTSAIGQAAEDLVARHIRSKGGTVIQRNWRHRRCEIDIIATKGNLLCFIEVKYRSNNVHGSGLEAITPAKQHQVAFGAKLYLCKDQELAKRFQPVLLGVEVSGDPMKIAKVVQFSADNMWDLG